MNLLKHDNVHTDLQGKRRVRYLEDEYAKLWQMYGDIEGERDRLRDALKNVRDCAEVTAPSLRLNAVLYIEEIVETALQEDGDE